MKLYLFGDILSGPDHITNAINDIEQLLRELESRGHDCTILLRDRSTTEEADLATVEALQDAVICGEDRISGAVFEDRDSFVDSVLDFQFTMQQLPIPDLIIAMTPICAAIAKVVTSVMDHPPKVVSRVSSPLDRYDDYKLIAYADAHLASSSGNAELILGVHPKAVVKTIFPPVPKEEIRIIPRDSTEQTTILYIGRIYNKQKRIDVLIRALAALPKKTWLLRIIGDFRTEPYITEVIRLRDMAFKLGVAGRIDWVEYHENPWDAVDEATLLVLPSDWESFGQVLVEALARGVPVIASNCPTGPSDIIEHGKNGWLFKPSDVLSLAGTISRLMSGSLTYPDAETCMKSVERFNSEDAMQQLEEAIVSFAQSDPQRQIS